MDKLARILAVVAWCALENSAFAQTTPPQPGTVTDMPYASTPLGGSELLYIVQGGVSKKISSGTFIFGSLPAIGAIRCWARSLRHRRAACRFRRAPDHGALDWTSGTGFGCQTLVSPAATQTLTARR